MAEIKQKNEEEINALRQENEEMWRRLREETNVSRPLKQEAYQEKITKDLIGSPCLRGPL